MASAKPTRGPGSLQDPVGPEFLSRDAAAEYFAQRGLVTLNERRLKRLATEGRGPRMWREGRSPYYRRDELEHWLANEWLQPVVEGRTDPKGV